MRPVGYWSAGAALAALLLPAVLAGACGARSELWAPSGSEPTAPDGGSDAGVDVSVDVSADVPQDVPADVPQDVPADVPADVIDPCTPEVTNIYVVTSDGNLWAFMPEEASFELRGAVSCPGATGSPFSMAVSQRGVAHVVLTDGTLWRVSVFDASCEATSFEPGQEGFETFGMGYATDQSDAGESLYVAEISWSVDPLGLGRIDTDTYQLEFIAPFSENFGLALELTPAGTGPLYGYWLNYGGNGGTLTQIDTTTAEIVESTPLDIGSGPTALAIAWWGGAFYVFTTPLDDGTVVTRYDPEDGSVVEIATLGERVVGAGVSTRAPASVDGG